jgi:hypothetical protein
VLEKKGQSLVGWGDPYLAGFVLGYFVVGVFFAVPALAVGTTGLGDVNLKTKILV